MEITCNKSVEAAREEALKITKGYITGMKICAIVMGIVLLVSLFTMEFEAALVFFVMLLIIFFIAAGPSYSRYSRLNKSVENDNPLLCVATRIGYARVGKRSVPAVYFLCDGQQAWATMYERKDEPQIEEGDDIYVWRSNTRKKVYVAIRAKKGM